LSVVAVMMILTIIAISFSGCSQGATNITGPSPTTTTTTMITEKDGDIAYLKQHNVNPTARISRSIVSVYDETGMAQSYLNEWGAITGLTFVPGPKGSGLDILIDNSILNCGEAHPIYGPIKIRTTTPCHLYLIALKHEIGHYVGFIMGHTTDGGVMDASSASEIITPPVANMLKLLYSFPVHTPIA